MTDVSALYLGTYSKKKSVGMKASSTTVRARFAEDATSFNSDPISYVQGGIDLDLTANSELYRNPVPRGIRFVFNGATYFDRGDGQLYSGIDPLTGSAIPSGTMNYAGGKASLTQYAAGASSLSVKALLVTQGQQNGIYIAFRTPGAPIAVGSLQITATALDGTELSVSADNAGNLTADEIDGTVHVDTGVVEMRFGHLSGSDWISTPVDLASIRYNTVVQRYVSLDAARLKVDPTRLPVDGRVPIFQPSQIVVIHNTKTEAMPNGLTAGQVVHLSRSPINKFWLYDAGGQKVPESKYSVDMPTGVVTMADPLVLTGYAQPLQAKTRVELMRQVNEVQINGLLKLADALTMNFGTSGTYVSTLLEFGDLQARYAYLFTQQVWGNVWSNSRIGSDSVGKYNDVAYPPIVNNGHTISERWAVVFTSTTTFQVLGEFSGLVITGNTGTDCSPLNPFTGSPLFTLKKEGWGAGGFVNNNVLRFNTIGAAVPVWLLRSIALGESDIAQDQGSVEFRTDVD